MAKNNQDQNQLKAQIKKMDQLYNDFLIEFNKLKKQRNKLLTQISDRLDKAKISQLKKKINKL